MTVQSDQKCGSCENWFTRKKSYCPKCGGIPE